MLQHVPEYDSFVWLSNIPSHVNILFIHSSVEHSLFASLDDCEQCRAEHWCLFESLFSFSLGTCLGVELLDQIVALCSVLRNLYIILHKATPFYMLPSKG